MKKSQATKPHCNDINFCVTFKCGLTIMIRVTGAIKVQTKCVSYLSQHLNVYNYDNTVVVTIMQANYFFHLFCMTDMVSLP